MKNKQVIIGDDKQETRPHISFSQYQVYKQCKRLWKIKYVDKVRPFDVNINTIYGKAMHAVLQDMLVIMFTQSKRAALDIDWFRKLRDTFMNLYDEERTKAGRSFISIPAIQSYLRCGCEGLHFLTSKMSRYFSTKEQELIGIEIPISEVINPSGLLFIGRIDVLLRNVRNGHYWIIDLKTSNMGWSNYYKTDLSKVGQVLLYKQFYGNSNNIDYSMIDTDFLIFRRNLPKSDYSVPYIQRITPSSGKVNLKRMSNEISEFVDYCYDGIDRRKDRAYECSTDANSCNFCIHKFNQEVCPKWKTSQ